MLSHIPRRRTQVPHSHTHAYTQRRSQHIQKYYDKMFKGVQQFTQQAVWNLMDVHDTILEHRIGQTLYSNKHRQPGVK